MSLQVHPRSLATAPVVDVARWLLSSRESADPGALADDVVLLPSSRAGDALRHALLEESGAGAVLLPLVVTAAQLADHLAAQLGLADDALPAPALRPLLLAPRLAASDWLQDRPEAAPGLARELVGLFDEVRWAALDGQVFSGQDDERLLGLAGVGAAEVLQADLALIRHAWRLYREAMPRDLVDVRIAALQAAAPRWPGPAPRQVVVAHVGRLDVRVAALLRQLAGRLPVHWLTFAADDPRSRLLLATYAGEASDAHPLAAARRIARRLGVEAPSPSAFAGADLPSRLAGLAEACRTVAPDGEVRLVAASDPEHESRVVAAEVCRLLQASQELPRIIVASPDRDLAARITAQLRDAGVDVDDTRGRPLASLPAGRLLRDLLHTVLGDWPFATLFEVLTHPYVSLGARGRARDASRVVALEMAIRRAGRARGGLAALRGIAAADDRRRAEAADDGAVHRRLADFVEAIAAALAPLAAAAAHPQPWPAHLEAIRRTWAAVAPARPLEAGAEPGLEIDDTGALCGVVAALDAAAALLGEATLAEVAAALDHLMSDAFEVRPHRQRHLPVQVMGLVEARLAESDHLLLAGLGQDVFPGNVRRPLLLTDGVRRALGLESWRDRIERDGELLLRLLHAAPRVTLSWPREREGRPALPSPLVMRLELVGGPSCVLSAAEEPLYRRQEPDWTVLAAAEAAYRGEPEPAAAPARPTLARLSPTSLRRHQDCPYAFLLAHPLNLRRTDPVTGEYTALDRGTLVHAAMQRFLAPAGEGLAALRRQDPDTATAAFVAATEAAFRTEGKDLPGRDIDLQSLLALASRIVEAEIARAGDWTPRLLETGFSLDLARVRDWLAAEGETPPALMPGLDALPLAGRIDRVDTASDGRPVVAIVDYKTGPLPTKRDIASGEAPQLALYALAVELGAVEALGEGPWRVGRADYYGLRHDRVGCDATGHLDAAAAGRAAMVAAARRLLAVAAEVADADARFALVPGARDPDFAGPLPCATCEFMGICRIQERDLEPVLSSRLTELLASDWRRGA